MAEEKTAHLFVGGPWDGRRIAVDAGAPFITAPSDEDSSVGVIDAAPGAKLQRFVMYRRASLRAPGREWIVFAAEDVADGDVIARLIDGYGVASES